MLEMLEDRTTPSSISGLSPNSGPLPAAAARCTSTAAASPAPRLVTLRRHVRPELIMDSATEIMAEIPAHAAGVVETSS